jgi:3-hydroxyisobutyrate dehydrogenase-like beta-hydroxyacid dehydrogenase
LGEEVRREACATRRGVPRRPYRGLERRRGEDLDHNGGDREETFVFKAFGKNVIYVGLVRYGQTMKLVNQVMLALNTVAMVEGLRLAKALGLDMEKMAQVLSPALSSCICRSCSKATSRQASRRPASRRT